MNVGGISVGGIRRNNKSFKKGNESVSSGERRAVGVGAITSVTRGNDAEFHLFIFYSVRVLADPREFKNRRRLEDPLRSPSQIVQIASLCFSSPLPVRRDPGRVPKPP